MNFVIHIQWIKQSLPCLKKVVQPGKCCSLNYHMKKPEDLMAYTVYN